MSSAPWGISAFSRSAMLDTICAASWTPRRWIPTMTRSSVPLFNSTISSAIRRSVRVNARASSTIDCFEGGAIVRPICPIRATNGSGRASLRVGSHLHARRRGVRWFALLEQAMDDAANDRIALARRPLQPVTLDDPDAAAAGLNQTISLELPERFRHTCAAHTEHLRDEVVRELHDAHVETVPHHQQPSSAARFNRMLPIAAGVLRRKREQYDGKAMQERVERRQLRQELTERVDVQTIGAPRHLHHRLLRRREDAVEHRHPQHTLTADRGRFDTAVRHDAHERRNAVDDEIHVAHWFVGPIQHLTALHWDNRCVFLDEAAFLSGERGKKLVSSSGRHARRDLVHSEAHTTMFWTTMRLSLLRQTCSLFVYDTVHSAHANRL